MRISHASGVSGVLVVLLTTATGFIAPTPAVAAGKVVVWHAYRGKERAALESVVATYNGRTKDRQVELLPIPYDAFADKVTASIPRGKGPDLFIFAQDRIGDWAASGLIEPVSFWVDDTQEKKYLGPTIEALRYDDQLYGLPIAFKMLALYYNTKLVTEPPKTTDELVAIARQHTKPSEGRYGLVYENANFYYQAAWFQGFGARVFDGKGAPTLDSPEAVESMRFAQHLAHQAGVMPEEVTSTLVTSLFNAGKAAMVLSGPWFRGELDDKLSYGVAVMPVITRVGKPAMPFLTAEAVIMSARAQDKEGAFDVMKYLTSAEAGRVMATMGGQPAAHGDVYEDPAARGDAILQVFRRQLDHTVPMPNTPAMRMVWSPVTTAMGKIINGREDPATAMKAAQAEVAKLVKGARR